MSFEYIEQTYGKRFFKGQFVVCGGKTLGVVTKATHYVFVRPEGQKHADPWHPNDVKPVDKDRLVNP